MSSKEEKSEEQVTCSISERVLHCYYIAIVGAMAILLVSEIFSLGILVAANPGQVADDLFTKNVLVPLTIVVAVASVNKKIDDLEYLLSSFCVLYCCVLYVYVFSQHSDRK